MRFVINFFIFGFIFFLIYHFFPEAFSTLVSWAQAAYDFAANLVGMARDKISKETAPEAVPPKALLPLLPLFFVFKR